MRFMNMLPEPGLNLKPFRKFKNDHAPIKKSINNQFKLFTLFWLQA